MSKFVSLSYFDLAELFRKSMFSITTGHIINLYICLFLALIKDLVAYHGVQHIAI